MKYNIKNETGNKYGRLTVLEYTGTNHKNAMWKCICDCGNYTTTRGVNLRSGNTKSCGCLNTDLKSEETKKKISEATKGKNHHNYGKKLPKETVKRMYEGSKKLNYQFVKEQFENEGYELLSKKYINTHTKLDYSCPKGHKHSITLAHFQNSRRCFYCKCENSRGENNFNWNPNITDEERQDKRYYFKYYKWRKDIYERDNYICQMCNTRGSNLVAHHIESYNNNLELRTTLTNGITFCKECHLDFHHQYGYGNNTMDQLNKFLYKEIL